MALEASPKAWRSQEEYHATGQNDDAAPATLQNHAGSWAAVVALVGLEMPSNAGHRCAMTEAERHAAKCGQSALQHTAR